MHILYPTVPSASPVDFRVVSTSPFSVSLEWGSVPCLKRNGQITSFVLQCLGNERNEILSVDSIENREITIDNLTTLTNYSFQIAAMTSAGTGVYSDVLTTNTGLNKIIVYYNER